MNESTSSYNKNSAQTNAGSPNGITQDPQQGSACRHLCSHLRLWPIAVAGLAVDLWTKHWAFDNIDPVAGKVIIPKLMSFHRSLNEGALFGLGKGWTPLFIIASFLALAFVLYLFAHSKPKQRSLHVGLALVLAGALGNLYDRSFVIADVVEFNHKGKRVTKVCRVVNQDETGITYREWPNDEPTHPIPAACNPIVRQQGVVRDFIKMKPIITIGDRQFEIWPWVFNIADVLLVVGVGLLMLNFWWERKEYKKTKTPPEPSSGQQLP